MRALRAVVVVAAMTAVAVPAAQAAPRLTKGERVQIGRAIDGFVVHAVRRSDPGAAYGLVSPTMRAGLTRREWVRDDGVYPYPARGRHFPWTIQYVEPGEVGGTLILQPRKGAKVGPVVFDLRLTKHHGRWLVESLIPAATMAAVGQPGKVRSVRDFSPQQASGDSSVPTGTSRVGSDYAVIPFAFFGVLLAGLASWFLVTRLRDRRIAREWASRPRPSIRADDARTGAADRP